MRAVSFLLLGFILFFSVAIFVIHSTFHAPRTNASDVREQHMVLMHLIAEHNETMNDLLVRQSFAGKSNAEIISTVKNKDVQILNLATAVAEQRQHISDKDAEIERLKIALAATEHHYTRIGGSIDMVSLPKPLTSMEQACDDRYGNGLLRKWKAAKQTWCHDLEGGDTSGSLICYPYHQEHKKLDGRGADVFCEARNLFMDFSKVTIPLVQF